MFLFMPQDVGEVPEYPLLRKHRDSLDQYYVSEKSVMNKCPQEVDKPQQEPEINGGRKYGIQYMLHTILMRKK